MEKAGLRRSKMRRMMSRILAVSLAFIMVCGTMEGGLTGIQVFAAETVEAEASDTEVADTEASDISDAAGGDEISGMTDEADAADPLQPSDPEEYGADAADETEVPGADTAEDAEETAEEASDDLPDPAADELDEGTADEIPLSGTIHAGKMEDDGYYILNGDTIIIIDEGDDKHIDNIKSPYGELGYNLTIQGSDKGKLAVDYDIYPSPSGSTKTLTITGGTIECGRYILAGGDIAISGGKITTRTLSSYDGDITISGGKIRAEVQSGDYPIHADNVTITGGYVSAFGGTYSAIAATDDIEITGGVIDARNRENASYGLEAGGDLTI